MSEQEPKVKKDNPVENAKPVNESKPIQKNEERNRKKRTNINGKIGINKHNNYIHISNAPIKLCQNCGSANNLNHLCKKPAKESSEILYGHTVALKDTHHPFYDKFDYIPCNRKLMTSCFNLRKELIEVALV